jgi:signal transduction histidine kinase
VRTDRDGDGSVMLSVSDAGHGAPADKLPRIFESFFTTKEHGMGLGLAIARSIIEAHGGRIAASNNPGGGATFCCTLPAATRTPPVG